MTKRARNLARQAGDAVTSGSGHASRPTGPLTPAHSGSVVHNDHADVAVRGYTQAASRKELPCPTRW
jgi:hypothetical protein